MIAFNVNRSTGTYVVNGVHFAELDAARNYADRLENEGRSISVARIGHDGAVRLSFDAPPEVKMLREELIGREPVKAIDGRR